MMRSLKRLSVLVAAAFVVTLAFGAGSALAKPCWKKLIDDWYDGRIDNTYSASCYRAALKNAPEDIRRYSDLQVEITRALASSNLARKRHGKVYVQPGSPGHNAKQQRSTVSVKSHNDRRGGVVPPVNGNDPPGGGPVQRALRDVGPSNSGSFPIPLIALGSLALLLIASGATGLVARRVRARRAASSPDV
jgi:hypothetical protein